MNLDNLYGTLQIAVVLLSITAGIIALSLFKRAWKKGPLAAWRPLIFVLILFAVEETLGALKAFGIYSSPFLTHIIPSVMLGLLITALLMEIGIKKRGAA